jgi:hypothetical protein
VSDFALEKGGILSERLQHLFLVLPEQGLHEYGRVAKVRRHADFGHANEMRLKHVVVHVAALEQFAEHVAHLLANAKQANRAAFLRFCAAHLSPP